MKTRSNLFHDISTRAAKAINVVLMALPFIYVWYTFYADKLWVRFAMRGHWLVIGLYVLLYVLIGRTYEAFTISYNSIGEMIYSQILTLFEVDVIIYIVAWLLIRRLPNPLPILVMFVLQILLSIIWCHWSQWWYFHAFKAYKTIIVWDYREGISELIEKYRLNKKVRDTKLVVFMQL